MAYRSIIGAILIVASGVLGAFAGAAAQDYPTRPVRMIVAFPAGGTLDTLARIISQMLSEKWGQSVFVENHPGAGGNIGAIYAARAPADGYSLHFGAQSLAVNVTIAPQAGFDPVKDFEPIILVATAQDVLMVPPSSTFHSVKELIDFAKAHPGQLNYASLGPGTSAHLATALFSDLVGIKMQNVSYSAVSQASTDVMSGRVSLFIPTLGGHLGHIKAGNARALAVSGAVRAEQLPDVPTFKELGIPFVAETSWYGIYAPKGTPGKIIAMANKDVSQILESPEVKKKSEALGFRLLGGSPETLGAMLKSEIAKWEKLAEGGSLTIAH
jgi:tripartite-type tricarboxylate transporter receptor subunit TctC